MLSPVQANLSKLCPKKGLNAEVLIDGFQPTTANDLFYLDPQYKLVAMYLLERNRGFDLALPVFPNMSGVDMIVLYSKPEDLVQHRLAYGMTMLGEVQKSVARMGLRLSFKDRSVARFVQAKEPNACIKFLEVMEGVDDLLVKFRYRDPGSNTIIKGSISL